MTSHFDTCTNAEPPRHHRWFGFLSRLAGQPQIDPGHLPGHLQRDMGFLDGNDPRGRRR